MSQTGTVIFQYSHNDLRTDSNDDVSVRHGLSLFLNNRQYVLAHLCEEKVRVHIGCFPILFIKELVRSRGCRDREKKLERAEPTVK